MSDKRPMRPIRRGTLRVALVSMQFVPGDTAFNLAQHGHWLDRAMAHRPDFVGFPEFALTGWIYEPGQMLSLRSPALREIDALARRHRVALATGFVENRGGTFYNTCLVAGPRGRLGVMRKVNLIAPEAEHYAAGRGFPVFDLGGWRLGVAICADATRYEMVHLLSLRGAEVIFAPHASVLRPYGNRRDGWVRWRMERWPLFARDACAAIAGVSCAGLPERRRRGETEHEYCGGAMVIDWTGEPVAALAGRTKREGLLVADLDLAALRAARRRHALTAEFRPEIVYNRRRGWAVGRAAKRVKSGPARTCEK